MATATMDLFAGLAASDAGMSKALEGRNELVNQLRQHLERRALGRSNRTASADDFEPFLLSIGKTCRDLGPAAGTVFQETEWEVAHFKPSERKSNHGRRILVWRLK